MAVTETTIGYDAGEYKIAKAQAWRLWVEGYTIRRIFRELGINFDGLHVGDFGSGTGIYSKMMIDLGASSVLAIEGDANMIQQAEKDNSQYSGLVVHQQAWLQDTNGNEDCQVVLGGYVMNYPKTPKETLAYCTAIASHLAAGGVFVGFQNNPFERTGGKQYKPYGFVKVHHSDTLGDSDGAQVDWVIDGMSDPIVNFNILPETYETCFANVGMKLHWRRTMLHPSQQNNSNWDIWCQGEHPTIAMVVTKGDTAYDLSSLA